MTKRQALYAALALLLAAITPAATTAGSERFTGRISILNRTPFTLQYAGLYMNATKDGRLLTDIILEGPFREPIPPGRLTYLGYAQPRHSQSHKLEGRLIFRIKDVQETFRIHYLITKKNDSRTAVKLEQDINDFNEYSGSFEDRPYRLVSVDMIKRCNAPQRRVHSAATGNDCVLVFSMTPEAIACLSQPDCDGSTFGLPAHAAGQHAEL